MEPTLRNRAAWEGDIKRGNGLRLGREIRSKGRFAALPILFLTGLSGEDEVIQTFDGVGSGYLNKPVRKRELCSKVNEILLC